MKRVGSLLVPTMAEEKRHMLAFVEQRIGSTYDVNGSFPIGVIRNEQMVCVVVYHDYRHPSIEISIAASSPRWATRPAIGALLGLPFKKYDVTRITSCIEKGNKRSVRFTEGVGFKREGVLRKCSASGKNLIIYGLLREEYEARYGRQQQEGRDSGDRLPGVAGGTG